MERPPDPGPSTAVRLAVALLAGFIVLLLLFPASGVDPQPPICYSIFGYSVPCEAWVAWAAAAIVAGLLGLYLWRRTPISADSDGGRSTEGGEDRPLARD